MDYFEWSYLNIHYKGIHNTRSYGTILRRMIPDCTPLTNYAMKQESLGSACRTTFQFVFVAHLQNNPIDFFVTL